MAQFIKLMLCTAEGKLGFPIYVNVNHITTFGNCTTQHSPAGEKVVMKPSTCINFSDGGDCNVKETPDEILAMINP